ncbi:MAG TPA: HNH endonuclease family protein [Candidatus Saccharimonadales bacterium]|nr:HNH endonuclease family protein [Candidatus Saccharimonadales bacterium]
MSRRWFLKLAIGLILVAATVLIHDWQNQAATPRLDQLSGDAATTLAKLPVKGRAPKTDYSREQFGNGWETVGVCDVREQILRRDLTNIRLDSDRCTVLSGQLLDPYTAQIILFKRGVTTSSDVQIDHIVALSDAWQKGAQGLSFSQRRAFANDPLELLAVDGGANQQKSDGDAATWLPENKTFRCSYVARQIAVKFKYHLWVTAAERDAMTRVLNNCPDQPLPSS